MKVNVADLVFDPTIYPRSQVNEFLVGRMMQALDAGAKFPDIIVESGTNRIVDGAHRHQVYVRKGIKTCNVTTKSYPDEAELFADCVRLNVNHGQSLTAYDVRSAVAKLSEMGYSRDKISVATRLPIEQIEKVVKGLAFSAGGEAMALKGGLSHLKGQTLSDKQREAQRHYGGHQALFYVRQIQNLIENDLWPKQSSAFADQMDALVQAWTGTREERAA